MLPRLGENEIVRNVEIQIDQSRTMHSIARDARWTIIDHAVAIVIASRSDVDRQPRIERQS